MQLHLVDVLIILGYLVLTVLIGFWISKRASKGLDSYFLGGNTLPWYVLGVSNASGMFDITGTMWLVALTYLYGLKATWIPWLWPVFNQIFLMMFLSAWMRRSKVLTGAEWIHTRFGNGRDATMSNIIVIFFAIVSVIGFLAYAFQGIGKFAYTFLPHAMEIGSFTFELTPNIYSLIFIGITAIYVVKGGMYSVVLTEVLQFAIMTVSSVAVGIIAMQLVSPEMLAEVVPDGWYDLSFGWQLDLQWDLAEANQKIAGDGYSLFGLFFMMMLFKGLLVSLAGPAPNYDMQRILSARTPREASLMSGIVNVALFFPRYMMITGIAILALVFMDTADLTTIAEDGRSIMDFERVLPFAINEYIPVGLKGILLAGLLAAFMSTVAATVNAAPAYLVNDIYKKYINPDADSKTYIRISYLASVVVVIVGIIFGYMGDSIHQITNWIVSGLFGGYAIANVFKWYWWRFNGYGYFWGMSAGIASALLLPIIPVDLQAVFNTNLEIELLRFPFTLFFSLLGCLLGTFLTRPDETEVLKRFYKSVRPWGFWKPIHEQVVAEDPSFVNNSRFGWDMMNVAIGIIWQTSFIVAAVYMVVQEYSYMLIGLGVLALTTLILKRTWYDRLED
ncbi:MAG: sodium:solute symporter family protein [Bacteroidota bacterium]